MKWIGSAVINSFVILKDQINIMEKVTVEFVQFSRFGETDIHEFTSIENRIRCLILFQKDLNHMLWLMANHQPYLG